ncbi:MAG: 30S ribosomal protein S15 [Nanoarchaeota archaeon]|nr:30S ribosomal protein S15 [Nanoarchaeota archaeon]
MARMYSRKKGRSGSKKPVNKARTWIRYKPKEVEMLIFKLAKEGKSSSEVGLVLRDTYGIPDSKFITKRKITSVIKEKGLAKELPEDLLNLIRRSVQIRKHLEENKKDMTALRGLQLTESKIRRLIKYYKETGVLPLDWKFDAKSLRGYAEQ